MRFFKNALGAFIMFTSALWWAIATIKYPSPMHVPTEDMVWGVVFLLAFAWGFALTKGD